MAKSLLTGTYNSGVSLYVSGAYSNPVTIGAMAYVYGHSTALAASSAWTVVNYGSITGLGNGVDLKGGLLTNASSGIIYGMANGVVMEGTAATVENAGHIVGGGFGGQRGRIDPTQL